MAARRDLPLSPLLSLPYHSSDDREEYPSTCLVFGVDHNPPTRIGLIPIRRVLRFH